MLQVNRVKRLLPFIVLLLLVLLPARSAFALAHWEGYCQQGGQKVVGPGASTSTTQVQQSYPFATLTVYVTGSSPLTKATLYSTNTGTSLANPLTCSKLGYFSFYAANSTVDLAFSGTGIAAPFTWGAVQSTEPYNYLSDLSPGNSLSSLCTLAASIGDTLIISQPHLAMSTQSLVSCKLQFISSGLLQTASGQTVTLPPNTNCPLTQQCFDTTTLGGTIAFSTPPPVLSPVQWGADITGTNDVSAAFKAAWAASAGSGTGGYVDIPCGTFKFTQGVTLATAQQETMYGAGGCTVLVWAGLTSSQDMITAPNCFACEIGHYQVSVLQPVNSTLRTQNAGLANTATAMVVKSIFVQGNSKTNSCFLLDGPIDGNNDQQKFEDDHCAGPISAGWTLGNNSAGFNVLNVIIEHSTCVGGGGSYCVNSIHGSFSFAHGDVGGQGVADFHIVFPSAGGYVIHDVESESSSSFLLTNVDELAANIDVSNVDWGDNCLGATPTQVANACAGYTPAGDAIHWGFAGPAHFRDSHFGTGGDANNLTLYCAFSQVNVSQPGCVFENVLVSTSNTTLAALFSTSGVFDSWINGAYEDSMSVYHLYPDTINAPKKFTGPVTFTGTVALPSVALTTYTPSLQLGGAAVGQTGTFTGHYFVDQGYTFFADSVIISALGSSTGAATVTLPSTAATQGFASFSCLSNCASLSSPITAYIGGGASVVTLAFQGASGTSALTNSNFTNTSFFLVSGWYK